MALMTAGTDCRQAWMGRGDGDAAVTMDRTGCDIALHCTMHAHTLTSAIIHHHAECDKQGWYRSVPMNA